MIYVAFLWICLLMFSRKARLILLPSSLFFTFNPLTIESIEFGVGIEAVALFGCILAISGPSSQEVDPKINQVLKAYIVFISVYFLMRSINWVVDGSTLSMSTFVAGELKSLLPPILFSIAIGKDIQSLDDVKLFLTAFLAAGTIAAIHGIFQYLYMLDLDAANNAPSWMTFGVNDPILVAQYLRSGRPFGPTPFVSVFGRNMAFLVLTATSVRLCFPKKLGGFSSFILPIAIVAVAFSQSFGAMTMIVVGILVFVFYGRIDIRVIIPLVVSLIIVAQTGIAFEPIEDKVSTLTSNTKESSMIMRFDIWRYFARQAFSRNPITGIWDTSTIDSDFVATFVYGGVVSCFALFSFLRRVWSLLNHLLSICPNNSLVYTAHVSALAIFAGTLTAAASGSTLFTPKNGAMLSSLLILFIHLGEFLKEETDLGEQMLEKNTRVKIYGSILSGNHRNQPNRMKRIQRSQG